MAFTHLHVHSEYSLLDGACRIGEMAQYAADMGQTALAITDHGVMYGAVAFYSACKAAGIKPIIGCEVYVAPRRMIDKEYAADSNYSHLILLCKNETGYRNLCYLVSQAFIEGFYIKPRIDWELLREHSEGLVCLSGCMVGEIPQYIINGDYSAAKNKALELREMFGEESFYLEVQAHGIREERIAAEGLIKLHADTGIPLVLTNDAHYVRREDAKFQDVLLCIQTGKTIDDPDRMRFQGEEFYLKSEDEMRALFDEPEMIAAADNTNVIADMCSYDFEFGHYHLPAFDLPEGEPDALSYLRKLCEEGFARRYEGVEAYADRLPELREQLDYELEMISKMGFTDYFLVVWDFIAYAKGRGIPVGPGRGSAAGSMATYCLDITDVDPIKYSLYFERFLNPERVSMPDIDIDFCVDRRGEVIDYVYRKYGIDHVAQIITFGTMAARLAIRDVGRALNVSYAECDAVAKQVPMAINMKLSEALKLSRPLRDMYEGDERIKELIDTAQALEGMPRHASTHAAGVVIAKEPLYKFVPLAKNDEAVVCQYTMNTLEELGLLKMDFLGLRNLTVLENAAEMVRVREPDFDVSKIPDDDAGVFEMLSEGRTSGVFQLESTGMTGVCTGLKPRSIEDITAVIALYRPGPMESIPRFIECKNHPEKIRYKHEMLRDILDVTYGCIVYQEQVIEICRRVAGFSLGQADMIRRAMSKKKEKVIKQERQYFIYGDPERNIPGAVARGVSEKVAGSIYDEILDFANYAFNKAHAVAYAIIAYRTAYMKLHYPREYMAALITSILDSSTKVAEYIGECREMGIRLLPPDVNESGADFTVCGRDLRFGLVAIKNIGRGFVNSVVEERQTNGKFTAFDDFCRRMAGRELNRRAVENLVRSGAFDSMGYRRSALLRVVNSVIDGVNDASRKNVEGQLDLFTMSGESDEPATQALVLPDVPEFTKRELMAMEKETTGLYLSGHPMDEYADAVRKARATPIGAIMEDFAQEGGATVFEDGQLVTLAGVIESAKTRTTRNDSLMCYIQLEDATGAMELIAFQRVLDTSGGYIKDNMPIAVKGRISIRDEKEPQLMVETLRPLTDAEPPEAAEKRETSKTLWVKLPTQDDPRVERIEKLLIMFESEDDRIVLYFEDTKKRMAASCLVHDALVNELKEMLGDENVVVK